MNKHKGNTTQHKTVIRGIMLNAGGSIIHIRNRDGKTILKLKLGVEGRDSEVLYLDMCSTDIGYDWSRLAQREISGANQ